MGERNDGREPSWLLGGVKRWQQQSWDPDANSSAVMRSAISNHEQFIGREREGLRRDQEDRFGRFLYAAFERQDVRIDDVVQPRGRELGAQIEVDIGNDADRDAHAVQCLQ